MGITAENLHIVVGHHEPRVSWQSIAWTGLERPPSHILSKVFDNLRRDFGSSDAGIQGRPNRRMAGEICYGTDWEVIGQCGDCAAPQTMGHSPREIRPRRIRGEGPLPCCSGLANRGPPSNDQDWETLEARWWRYP